MRHNKTRHSLLKKLFKKFDENKNSANKDADVIGLTLFEIDDFLKSKKDERDLVLSELVKSEEIVFFNLKEKGYFINPVNGLSALTEKKYLKRNNDIITNWFKVFTQIAIPILSLIIAILVLTLKFKTVTENIETKINQKHKIELKRIELKLDSIINLKENKKIIPSSKNQIQ